MNDELTIAGKRYVSSKRAAQISGYAKDYVGQLCRGNKLEAKLIGRNWYITMDSLSKIRKKHLLDQIGATKIAEIAAKKPHPNTSNLLDELDVEFYSDDTPLIPTVQKKIEPEIASVEIKKVHIEPRIQKIEPKEEIVDAQPMVVEDTIEETIEREIDLPNRVPDFAGLRPIRLTVTALVIAVVFYGLAFPFVKVEVSYDRTGKTETAHSMDLNMAATMLSLL